MFPRVRSPRRPGPKTERSAFVRGPNERKLVVLLDTGLSASDPAVEILLEMREAELASVYLLDAAAGPRVELGQVHNDVRQVSVLSGSHERHTGVPFVSQWTGIARQFAENPEDAGENEMPDEAVLVAIFDPKTRKTAAAWLRIDTIGDEEIKAKLIGRVLLDGLNNH